MATKRTVGLLVSACCVVAIGACGEQGKPASSDTPPDATQTTQGAAPADGSPGGESCKDVMVPGHEAVEVKATGAECGAAEQVAADAEGRGRAAYESQGFACEPSEASGGDTNYTCSMGSAKVTFRYGTTSQ